jgi:hypothetical protein
VTLNFRRGPALGLVDRVRPSSKPPIPFFPFPHPRISSSYPSAFLTRVLVLSFGTGNSFLCLPLFSYHATEKVDRRGPHEHHTARFPRPAGFVITQLLPPCSEIARQTGRSRPWARARPAPSPRPQPPRQHLRPRGIKLRLPPLLLRKSSFQPAVEDFVARRRSAPWRQAAKAQTYPTIA